jgi:quercetin dioxygenase-like cupin family protein
VIRQRLSDMKGGWFVGDFAPVVLRTSAAEVAVKTYAKGAREDKHVHRVAHELTLILSGSVRMNGVELGHGDIVMLEPGEPTDFEALTDVTTVVVKVPSIIGDKYAC